MGRRGYSFTELIVVVTVGLVLFGGILIVLSESGRKTWLTTEAQLDSQTEAQRAIDRISQDLRRANVGGITTCTNGVTLVIDPIDDTDAGTDDTPVTYDFTAPASATSFGSLARTQSGTTLTISARLAAASWTCDAVTGVVSLGITSRSSTREGPSQGRFMDYPLTTNVWVQIP